jgi:hypothetical protein
MKSLVAILMCSCMTLVAGNAAAASDMEKSASAPMAQDGMMKKAMSMQDCKDHMAMAKKGDAMAKKDDAMMKKDAMCDEMMKKGGMMKEDDAMMKKDEPMKK